MNGTKVEMGFISIEYDDKLWSLFIKRLIPQIVMTGYIEQPKNGKKKVPKLVFDILINKVVLPMEFVSVSSCSVYIIDDEDLSSKLSNSTEYLLNSLEEDRYSLYGDIMNDEEKISSIFILYFVESNLAIYTIESKVEYFSRN